MDELIIIGLCLILNALFAGYEMAFVSVTRGSLRSLAKKGNPSAKRLLLMRDNPERTLSIIQIGITLVGAIAAAVGGSGASENLEPYLIRKYGMPELTAEVVAVIMVVLPITYLSVVVGELVPKTLALRAPAKVAIGGAKALFFADRILSPIVTALEWSTKKLLSLFFPKAKAPEETKSPSTIEIDELSPVHQKFVLNLAGIEKRRIRDMLVPWEQVNFIRQGDSIEEVTQAVVKHGHTRLPVVDGEKVTGVLHTKEFIALKESGEVIWQPIVRPYLKIQSQDSVIGVLCLMQESRNHLAIVFSPLGQRLGIVTMEDIIEEIVGDIYDEDDDEGVRKIFASKIKTRFRP